MTKSGSKARARTGIAPRGGAVLRRACACGNHARGASCDECSRDAQRLRREPSGDGSVGEAPAIVDDVLRSPGTALDDSTRASLEPAYGRDLSHVRVHADGSAAESARAIDARAYTVGSQIVFGDGQYRPETPRGLRLLAHELAHVGQQATGAPAGAGGLEIGDPNAAEEHEADRTADAVVRERTVATAGVASGATTLRRSPVAGTVGWKGSAGPNKGTSTVDGIERIPLDLLAVGHQSGKSASGRAIVLRSPSLDVTKPVDVLLHFHGHNAGYEESGKSVRDVAIDNVEKQLASSGRPQLVAILPQGTADSSFGVSSTGASTTTKSFDPDAYVSEVFDVLVGLKAFASKPSVSGVAIAGHSGAGELINEKILGSALGSSIGSGAGPTTGSRAPKALKEIALFDAINGPMEHARLSEFLRVKMAAELTRALAESADDKRAALFASGFKFRAYFSHAPKIGAYYSQWHVGPVTDPKAVSKTPIKELIEQILAASAAALGGTSTKAYAAFEANYRVIDAGAKVAHDDMVGANDHLKDAIAVLPRRASGADASAPAEIPRSVHDTLASSGRPLAGGALSWANEHFGRDLSHVRVHDDARAAESARSVGAVAYTAGRDVVFGAGRFESESDGGRRLLAHELAHVIQQGARPAATSELSVGPTRDALEAEADRAADPSAGRTAARGLGARGTGPRIQRAPKTVDAAMCEATKNDHPAELGTCNYKEPENCPTYEGWIGSLAALKTFKASDTPGANTSDFDVIGGAAADKDFRAAPKGGAPGPAPDPKPFAPLKPGERFVDHPTDAWVKTCLPENLRATAYQLPADCADVAIILRHVWLAAHHRTQKMGDWTLGSEAGKAEEKNVHKVIDNVGTESVADLVAPYSDSAGKPMRSIKQLAPLLHVGDVLVWWHFDNGFDKGRTGGHTHTISSIERDDTGGLKRLGLLQGNEPLFGRPDPTAPVSPANPARQKEDIQDFLKKENPKKAPPDDKTLGTAPGRRIERVTSASSGLTFTDSEPAKDKSPAPIWKWGAETLLVVAGPPRSAPRPAMQPLKRGEKAQQRRLADWAAPLKTASAGALVPLVESMLLEARATVEGGGNLDEAEARAVGTAAGARLWALAKAAKDLGNASHFEPLQTLNAIFAELRRRRPRVSKKDDAAFDVASRLAVTQLGWIADAFELAARGISSVDFTAGVPAKTDAVNVLVTGFDPFDSTGSLRRPGPGEWNPSGAAALALDGARLPLTSTKGAKRLAAVESVVFPVSFDDFRKGVVERTVAAHAKEVDAVLTVSMDPSLDPADSVRLERYAVGVHNEGGKLDGVPAADGGGPGAAIVESNAPLKEIAANTKAAATGGAPAIDEPTIGEGITFRFASPKDADAALKALGLPARGAATVKIGDEAALRQIVSTMKRAGTSPTIEFKAGASSFSATVLSGPGGDFLSNEVSFRALRLLGATASAKRPISFHTHTQRGDAVPADDGTVAGKKARKDATSAATALRAKLVETLKRIVAAVGRAVLDRRTPPKP